MGVFIARNLKKESKCFDIYGNEINPITKEVIRPKEEPKSPTPEQLEKMQKHLEMQAKLEAEGKGPATWQDALKNE